MSPAQPYADAALATRGHFEERFAIMQFDGGLPFELARRIAFALCYHAHADALARAPLVDLIRWTDPRYPRAPACCAGPDDYATTDFTRIPGRYCAASC